VGEDNHLCYANVVTQQVTQPHSDVGIKVDSHIHVDKECRSTT